MPGPDPRWSGLGELWVMSRRPAAPGQPSLTAQHDPPSYRLPCCNMHCSRLHLGDQQTVLLNTLDFHNQFILLEHMAKMYPTEKRTMPSLRSSAKPQPNPNLNQIHITTLVNSKTNLSRLESEIPGKNLYLSSGIVQL